MLKKISLENVNRVAMLIIGPAGVGKTSLLRTIKDPVCVLSAEAGLLCVRDLVETGKIDGFEITSIDDFRQAYQFLLGPDAKKKYSWVFIDSLTEIGARCEDDMKKKYPSSSDSFKMWGEYSSLMQQLVKGFRDLSAYNIVMTCLETIDQNETKKRYAGPMMAGRGLKDRLPSYFDEVLYMENIEDKRVLITQPYYEFPGKDRSGNLSTFEKPDLGEIIKKILTKKLPKTDEGKK